VRQRKSCVKSTAEGRAYNIGAILDGDKGKVTATTPFSSFALIVTAEPHFAVSVPSKYIVLQNVAGKVQGQGPAGGRGSVAPIPMNMPSAVTPPNKNA
jgi:hypothetical protein